MKRLTGRPVIITIVQYQSIISSIGLINIDVSFILNNTKGRDFRYQSLISIIISINIDVRFFLNNTKGVILGFTFTHNLFQT